MSIFLCCITESDCILHGYIKKLGGPFASAWQTRYAKLYPNRLELHPESGNGKPELIFMDQLEDVSADLVIVKNEQCIILKTKDTKIVLTNSVSDFHYFCLSDCFYELICVKNLARDSKIAVRKNKFSLTSVRLASSNE